MLSHDDTVQFVFIFHMLHAIQSLNNIFLPFNSILLQRDYFCFSVNFRGINLAKYNGSGIGGTY